MNNADFDKNFKLNVVLLLPGARSLMAETSFLMESETALLLFDRVSHIGGSCGFIARDLAA